MNCLRDGSSCFMNQTTGDVNFSNRPALTLLVFEVGKKTGERSTLRGRSTVGGSGSAISRSIRREDICCQPINDRTPLLSSRIDEEKGTLSPESELNYLAVYLSLTVRRRVLSAISMQTVVRLRQFLSLPGNRVSSWRTAAHRHRLRTPFCPPL